MTDRRYKGVSLEAKALYGLLLDRMGLSARNGWLDDSGRVFLYFTQEEAMAMFVNVPPMLPTHILWNRYSRFQESVAATERKIPRIPPKPVMSAEAATYPKLSKIYKELNKQNGIIFDAEKERNALELKRDNLKGLARLTKKGEIQSKIDRKNEEIDLLKVGLSGIAKRYGFQTVHDFYKVYATAKIAYAEYRDKADRWEELYGENAPRQTKESVHRRLQDYQRANADRQAEQTSKNKGRETR